MTDAAVYWMFGPENLTPTFHTKCKKSRGNAADNLTSLRERMAEQKQKEMLYLSELPETHTCDRISPAISPFENLTNIFFSYYDGL